MKTQFIECKSRMTAKRRTWLWAAIVAKVTGGYMCFESCDDYKTWKNQK